MKYVMAAMAALLMAGCGGVPTRVLSTSERTVAIGSLKGMQDAQNTANVECARYGRTARWIGGVMPEYIYDCVN